MVRLAQDGLTSAEIARRTGVPRRTVANWRAGALPSYGQRQAAACFRCSGQLGPFRSMRQRGYAYLLGLYLGDGHLAELPRGVWSLRIYLDAAYPAIAEECTAAMSLALPSSRTSVRQSKRASMLIASSNGKHWSCLVPQHGGGPKHRRVIALEPWQVGILDRHPWMFLRGLIHSDGCRFSNPSIHRDRTYRYTRYSFSNRSDEIRELFCRYCDAVGVEWKRMNRWNISIARRPSVTLMDRHIGPKR